jgi:glycosyltransferase involved in cell wall biosynthesis
MAERVILVHSDRGHEVDGIRDHTARLGRELAREGQAVSEVRPLTADAPGGRRGGSLRIWRALDRAGGETAAVVQYSPFCYGRWGFAPWLPAYLLALRSKRRRPALALMVHEPYVPMDSWRWALMGLWQRLQLGALRLGADVVFTSIEPWARRFAARPPRRPVHHLPVGSNFPDARRQREEERRRLGLERGALAIGCLGRDHPGWLGEYVVAAVNAVAASGADPVLVNLGAQAPELPGIDPAVRVHAPGYLEPEAFAATLAASDLFLVPVADGVSTRRGSLMAALQHGLPVLGTAGPLTDSVLREAAPALALTGVGDAGAFAATAAALAEDPDARRAAGAAARELYEREFDWPVIGARLLAALPAR